MSNNDHNMDELQQQFPDLTRSMIRDVFSSVEGNLEHAQQLLKQFTSKEPSEDEIARLMRELESFDTILGKEVILKTLKDNKWDANKAMVALLNVHQEKQKEDRTRRREQERAERIRLAKEKASTFMKDLYSTVPEEKIHELLEQNDGDVNATVEMIMNMEDDRERKTREEEKIKLDKLEKCNALATRFNKTTEEVERLLNQLNWDIKMAIEQLLNAEQDAKFKRMTQLYNFRRQDEIRHALETNNYDEQVTIKFIDDKIAREKAEAERRAREREVEKKRIEELQRKQIEELKIRQQNEKAAKEAQLLQEQQKRLFEQQQAESERLRLEKERMETEARLAKEREEEQRTLAAAREALLHRSMILADEIQKETLEVTEDEVLKKAIEDKIRKEAGPAFLQPNPQQQVIVPPQRQQQTQHNPPVVVAVDAKTLPPPITTTAYFQESAFDPSNPSNITTTTATTNTSTTTITTTSTTTSIFSGAPSSSSDADLVRIEAHPSQVDYGETITVTYEAQEPANPSNWIGLYREGAQSKEYETYDWAITQKGSITFKAPLFTGKFFFRFLVNKTYTSWGTSNIVEVGPKFKMTPSLSENTVTIKVDQLSGLSCPSAWVAMYEPNRDHRNYYNYCYLPTPPTSLSFKIPKVGTWEFRLFPQKVYNVAETCQVEFKGSDSLFMEVDAFHNQVVITHKIVSVDPCYDNVWVGIYHTTETDIRQYRRYKRITMDNGNLMMKALQTPGTYEARLFSGVAGGAGAPKVIVKSNTISVTPKQK